MLPLLAARWIQKPFLGAFLEQTLVFNGVGPQSHTPWAAIDAGLAFPAHLTGIDGVPVHSTRDLNRALAVHQVGDTISIQFELEGQQQPPLSLTLQAFPTRDTIAYFVVPYIIGLVYLGLGLWVFRIRWREAAGRLFAVFCANIALILGGLFDLYTTHVFSWAWTIAISLASASLVTLALVFPQEARPVARYPALRWLAFIPAFGLAGAAEAVLYDIARPTAYAIAWRNEFYYSLAGILAFLGFTLYRSRMAPSPIARGQARIILLGSAVAFGPIGYFLATSVGGSQVPFNVTLYFPAMIVFPLAVAYAILRYRLLDTDVLIVRSLSYGLLALVAAGFYTLLVYAATWVLGRAVLADSPVILGIFVVVFGLALNPLRRGLQVALDAIFFRGTRAYRERLRRFGHALTVVADLPQVLSALCDEIEITVPPAAMHVFLRDVPGAGFEAVSHDGNDASEIRFDTHDALPAALALNPGALYLAPGRNLPTTLLKDHKKLSSLQAVVFIPFHGNRGLAGWLALGPRRSGEPYTREALGFLEAIGGQAALAIERAQLFEAEHEQRQLAEALSDTAAALTSTLDFNEVLARILENVGRVVPHDSANIMLIDGDNAHIVRSQSNGLHPPIPEDSPPLPLAQFGTLQQMIANGQPLLVGDTLADENWNDIPQTEWVHSYAGAPIRTHQGVIGFLNLNGAEREFFPPRTADALQAFADQAGVAIENARLFDGLQRSHVEISEAYDATLEGWVRALDLRDHETEGHTQRVTELTLQLGRELGLDEAALLHLRRGALLHDIGKIGIPDSILRKPGPLTDAERDLMRRHPQYAYDMLKPIVYLRPALDIPYCHHEKWDGSGYPRQLKQTAIPLAARVFTIVDVWDALCSDRPYRLGWKPDRVLAYIDSLAGAHFDPDIVAVFHTVVPRHDKI